MQIVRLMLRLLLHNLGLFDLNGKTFLSIFEFHRVQYIICLLFRGRNLSTLEISKELDISKEEILNDYRIASESRQASILARKEVFMGKAKFGIFGTGKELAQIAMAKYFEPGDFRSGYYRDQTFMMAIDELTIKPYYAQLYRHTDIES